MTKAHSGHVGNSGIQKHSCGPLFPWVHTQVGNDNGVNYWKHPDGSETPHRPFHDRDSWRESYRLAEEDCRRAKGRKERAAEADRRLKQVQAFARGEIDFGGRELPNGAKCIHHHGEIVLCKYGQEYVTWVVNPQGYCEIGRYFPGNGSAATSQDFVDAVNNFAERAGLVKRPEADA